MYPKSEKNESYQFVFSQERIAALLIPEGGVGWAAHVNAEIKNKNGKKLRMRGVFILQKYAFQKSSKFPFWGMHCKNIPTKFIQHINSKLIRIMAAYDITFSPASGNGALSINVDSNGGDIKLLGSKLVAEYTDGSDQVYYFAIVVQAGNPGGPDPIRINSTSIIPGKNVRRDDGSNKVLNVVVIEKEKSGDKDSKVEKESQVEIKI